MKIYTLVGMMGSGKSTWAKDFIKQHTKTKIVCSDSFRKMLNGEYEYIVELDDVITESMFATASNLIGSGYDVIIDCGNLTDAPDRRQKWLKLKGEHIAVIFPRKNKEWHLKNRVTMPHRETNLDKIWERENAAYEDVKEENYNQVIRIEEW